MWTKCINCGRVTGYDNKSWDCGCRRERQFPEHWPLPVIYAAIGTQDADTAEKENGGPLPYDRDHPYRVSLYKDQKHVGWGQVQTLAPNRRGNRQAWFCLRTTKLPEGIDPKGIQTTFEHHEGVMYVLPAVVMAEAGITIAVSPYERPVIRKLAEAGYNVVESTKESIAHALHFSDW